MAEQQKSPLDGIDLGSSRLAHLAEQAEANLPLMAGLLGTFYKSLVKQGLPEDLVQCLVLEWFNGVIAMSAGNRED